MAKEKMAEVAKGLEGQIAFCEKLLRLLETEGPKNHLGVLERPFRGWAASLRVSIETGQQWIESCKRTEGYIGKRESGER